MKRLIREKPKRQITKIATTAFILWLLSSAAMSNGPMAPELPLLEGAKSSAEYPILKQMQDLTFDLQMLELIIKNRRNEQIESKINSAVSAIESESKAVGQEYAKLRTDQHKTILSVLKIAAKYSKLVGVEQFEWSELEKRLISNDFKGGLLYVHQKDLILGVLNLSPIKIGKQMVWEITIPENDRFSFWNRAFWSLKKMNRTGEALSVTSLKLQKLIAPANTLHKKALDLAEAFYRSSHKKLYDSFEEQRYGIMSRMHLAKKALLNLSEQPGAMGTPEEFSALYNQLLDNLYSYGVDISFGGDQRDFKIKGFLFSDTPESAKELLKKLKVSANGTNTYNSPSS